MKTIKMTVRHGETLETATGTGATIHEAIAALKSQQRLGGYVIDNTREAYPSFADTLETSGRAQHGWADYEIVQEDEAPAPASTGHAKGKEHLAITAQKIIHKLDLALSSLVNGPVRFSDKSNNHLSEHDPNVIAAREAISHARDRAVGGDAARIVACVNACEGMADPAAEIKALRDALKMAIEWSKEVPAPYREFPFIAAARAALGVQP